MRRARELLKKRVVLLDGAMGTNLLTCGLAPGESPGMLNVRKPDAVFALHRAYIAAGSDIILTNTFNVNPNSMASRQVAKILRTGAAIAHDAAQGKALVLGDIGPLGEMVEPYGDFPFDAAYEMFRRVARILRSGGVKGFVLETFTSIAEAKAAFLAVREFSDDVFVCFSLQDNCRTLMGELPETIAVTFDALGARGVGVNCTHPGTVSSALSRMAKHTSLPLIAKPNAGRITFQRAKMKHTLSDGQLAKYYDRLVQAGAQIVGGCCGTTPAFIQQISRKKKKSKKRIVRRIFSLAAPSNILNVDKESHIIVGERLNPSGRKSIQRLLGEGDYARYAEDAKQQEEAGADILDVNAFIADRDEEVTLKGAVGAVLKRSRLPLFIDTQNVKAARAVLAFYPGIGVLNSVAARVKDLRLWLPLVKRFGFKVVISLIGSRIPRSVEERLQNVVLVLRIARELRFSRDDLIFDPLVFSLATDDEQVDCTLNTVKILTKRGLKTVLGISNVSFGLPQRSCLNAVMATAAVRAGVTFLIINPLDMRVRDAVIGAAALYRGDVHKYLVSMRTSARSDTTKKRIPSVSASGLCESLVAGNIGRCVQQTQHLLKKGIHAQKIIDQYVTKAMQRIGEQYEYGEAFIPDLLQAADAARHVLDVLKPRLPRGRRRGKIMLATVKGDIHDIGKNIAGMVFEAAGYHVIDLGKDVSVQKILAAVRRDRPDVLGLSALLTTTMPEMARVIENLRASQLKIKVIIGGPNVTKKYADMIGAYGAATNVRDGLRLVKAIL